MTTVEANYRTEFARAFAAWAWVAFIPDTPRAGVLDVVAAKTEMDRMNAIFDAWNKYRCGSSAS